MYRFLFVLVVTICLIYLLATSCYSQSDSSTFRAAVYEFQRFHFQSTDQIDLLETKRINLRSYAKAIDVASKHGADIIVFPESGLFTASNRALASVNYEYMPSANESITPCTAWPPSSDQTTSTVSVYSLSCLAREFSIYVAAILGEKINCSPKSDPNCPHDGHYMYNTLILFDGTGKLIAKYHKTHLFFEVANDTPVEPEVVTVETPFGKLGFIICFDLHYEKPALSLIYDELVDTIVFGAHWVDETPFLNAHRAQAGFSIEHKVNLLAAGINDLAKGALGSGIYVAGEGPIIYTADITKGGSRLLIADIPKSRRSTVDDDGYFIEREDKFVRLIDDIGPIYDLSSYVPWTVELDLFNRTKLTETSASITLCTQEMICCQLDYSLRSPTFTKTYYLLVKRWIRPTTKICEQFCGLVAYDSTDYAYTTNDSFSYLQLTGTFSGNLAIPSVVTNNFQLISKSHWDYTHKDNVATITVDNNSQPHLGVTLYSRYEKDDQQLNQTTSISFA